MPPNMKTKFAIVLCMLAAIFAVAKPLPLRAQEPEDDISFDFFYDSLKPYGEWLQIAEYGLCWRPVGVEPSWAPYRDGYWAFTDGGWTWVSYEDFGGIVYHYGRWVSTLDVGWCWVPDYEWAPAWVSWRSSEAYIGWAPLPPECHWTPEVGIGVWADDRYDIGPDHYHFCPVPDFGSPVILSVLIPPVQNVAIIQNTVNITNITVNPVTKVVFVGGPRYDLLKPRLRRPVPLLKLVQQTHLSSLDLDPARPVFHSIQKGNSLFVPSPKVRPVANTLASFPQIRPSRFIPATRVTRGWGMTRTAELHQKVKAKMQKQTEGLTPSNSPAKPMNEGELKDLPTKSDGPPPIRTRKANPEAVPGATPSDPHLVGGGTPSRPFASGKGTSVGSATPRPGKRGKQPKLTPQQVEDAKRLEMQRKVQEDAKTAEDAQRQNVIQQAQENQRQQREAMRQAQERAAQENSKAAAESALPGTSIPAIPSGASDVGADIKAGNSAIGKPEAEGNEADGHSGALQSGGGTSSGPPPQNPAVHTGPKNLRGKPSPAQGSPSAPKDGAGVSPASEQGNVAREHRPENAQNITAQEASRLQQDSSAQATLQSRRAETQVGRPGLRSSRAQEDGGVLLPAQSQRHPTQQPSPMQSRAVQPAEEPQERIRQPQRTQAEQPQSYQRQQMQSPQEQSGRAQKQNRQTGQNQIQQQRDRGSQAGPPQQQPSVQSQPERPTQKQGQRARASQVAPPPQGQPTAGAQ